MTLLPNPPAAGLGIKALRRSRYACAGILHLQRAAVRRRRIAMRWQCRYRLRIRGNPANNPTLKIVDFSKLTMQVLQKLSRPQFISVHSN